MAKADLVFISCGQVTDQEKKLGADVCSLVKLLTPHEPYFAEQESSLEAFTQNILGSLDRAVALIAIMHPRGKVAFPDRSEHIRASVWIEQEIAIAAYITQLLRRPLKVAAYSHADIRREGMRQQLPLNPILFTNDQEVLDHLRGILPSWKELRASPRDLNPILSKVRVALERGHTSNYLFKCTNDSDLEVVIHEIKLESQGVLLTEPIKPETPNSWNLRPNQTSTFGRVITHLKNPAASLVAMNDNLGLFFNTEIYLVSACEVGGQTGEIRNKQLVRVKVASNE